MRLFGHATEVTNAAGNPRRAAFERKLSEERRLKFKTNLALAIAVLIAVVVCWFHGGMQTTSITAFGAALGLGGVLGFLFGVPGPAKAPVNIGQIGSMAVDTGSGSMVRAGDVTMTQGPSPAPPHTAPQPPPPPQVHPAPDPSTAAPATPSAATHLAAEVPATAPSPAAAVKSASDTPGGKPPAPTLPTPETTSDRSNLEQVADWVTKLLLGGGLTQMQRIPPKIWQWSHAVAVGIIGSAGASPERIVAEQAFACGLMVYGFILGFFGGFLITKLQLGKAIAE